MKSSSIGDEVFNTFIRKILKYSIAQTSFKDQIVFFGFRNIIDLVSITSIKPNIDGFTIKIGKITCVLVYSCCTSSMTNLRLPLSIRYGYVYDVSYKRPFASWFSIGKRKLQISITTTNMIQPFELHDKQIVDFNPS